jgi:ubiquinone/menaquinone biosynthesis C-methylase UbiE
MHNEKVYHGGIERLRNESRVALLEIPLVLEYCIKNITVNSMLDIGTGTGLFAEAFIKQGIKATGIDINKEFLEEAKRLVPDGLFKEASADTIPFEDNSFGLVFLGHILHESPDIVTTLKEAKRVARQRVCVLEWPYKEQDMGPPLHHRLKPHDVLNSAIVAGFINVGMIEMANMVLLILDF